MRMAGTPIFMDGVIVSRIAGFQAQNPEVRIGKSYVYAADLAEKVLRSVLDLAICPLRHGDLPDGLQFDTMLPDSHVIAAREGHPLLHGHAVTAADLQQFPWITPPTDNPLHADLQRVLSTIKAEKIRVSFSGGSLSAVMGMLVGSDSLTVLPCSVLFTLRRQYRVAALSIRIEHPDRTPGLVYLRHAPLSPAARRMRSFILAQFETLAATIFHHERQSLWRR